MTSLEQQHVQIASGQKDWVSSVIITELPADPFVEDSGKSNTGSAKDYVHIRIQQRNGRKSLTTVQGIKASYDYKKILKALKKEYCCNGTVVDDDELGQVIQVQGDQRKNIADFLTNNKIVKKDLIKVHGF